MSETGIGASVKRVEDQRFLTGKGNYTDDINRAGQTHAYILRSPHAHARITAIDTSAAESAPGVVAVFTGKDVARAASPASMKPFMSAGRSGAARERPTTISPSRTPMDSAPSAVNVTSRM